MRQIWITKAGPPETLVVKEAPDPVPKAGEARIRVEASGINFADVMGRLGLYPDLPKIPCVPGYEVAGRVDAVGQGVGSDWIGRDVFAMTHFGGYADVICAPTSLVFRRPEGLSARGWRGAAGQLSHGLATHRRHGVAQGRRDHAGPFGRRGRRHRRDPDRQASLAPGSSERPRRPSIRNCERSASTT